MGRRFSIPDNKVDIPGVGSTLLAPEPGRKTGIKLYLLVLSCSVEIQSFNTLIQHLLTEGFTGNRDELTLGSWGQGG